MNTSMRPHASSADLTYPATSSDRLTSARANRASPPAAATSSAVSPPFAASRSTASTFAPALASARHAARPMPPPAPVTMEILSVRSSFMREVRERRVDRTLLLLLLLRGALSGGLVRVRRGGEEETGERSLGAFLQD